MEASELVPEESCWHRLPAVCLQNVFWWLQDKDRFNAALVCKTWNQAMNSAVLWRSIRLVYGGKPTKVNAAQFESDVENIMHFGRYLKNLEIRFINPYNAVTNRKFQIVMRRLLACLGRSNNCLHSLAIRDLGLDLLFWRVAIRNSFIRSLSFFLKKTKKTLTHVNFKGARMTMEQGCTLLNSLSCPTNVSPVSLLDIEDYFSYHLPVYTYPNFTQVIAKFSRLANLSLNYNCISDNFLETLAETCASTLHTLNIKCYTKDPHRQVVCGTSWYKLSSMATDLRVNIYLERVGKHEHLVRILLAEIPMRHISIRNFYSRDPFWPLSPTIVDLIPQYRRMLQKLTIHVNNYPEELEIDLMQLVLHCEHLHSLKLWAFIKLWFVEYLLQLQQEGKCCLRTLKMKIFIQKDATREEDEILHEIEMRYKDVIDNGMNYFVIASPRLWPTY